MEGIVHPWLPNSSGKVIEKMLKTVGVENIEELFSDIPESVRLKLEDWLRLDIGFGRPLSEIEVRRIAEERLSKNRVFRTPPFMGGGVYPHYVPPVVRYIISRGEFLTAYTPYQPEISQGLMQAIFEYQSLIAELLDMDVVNASMYDWASALAEAILMAIRVKKGRRKVVIPANVNPFHKKVAETYAKPHDIIFVEVPFNRYTGEVNVEQVKNEVDNNTAAVYVQYPNFFGIVESNVKEIFEIAHEKDALAIAGVYPISLGILKPPGELGADIAVGDGQSLGLGLNYGGPYLGIFAVRDDMSLIRQMPGRLIGLTTTLSGDDKAFAMVLQTREQHIRREKATSNICTNEALMAIASAVYLSLLGSEGLRKLAEINYYNAHYAQKKLSEIGVNTRVFSSDFFNEFPVSFDPLGIKYERVHEGLLEKGIHGGLYIGNLFRELGETALFAFTEMHTKQDIDLLAESIASIVRGAGRW
ncbi:aminomethyl-transferring glycine dehydrogenase subunit GcvPA [Thermogladius sp. 4427co]|uniref:aminomethyl-transferring glycine dehydrogenase subunit GcvPA n=1 Tax=Thermogladius sp. 4427co TaxID=3450718 RepID=UPI003F7AF296